MVLIYKKIKIGSQIQLQYRKLSLLRILKSVDTKMFCLYKHFGPLKYVDTPILYVRVCWNGQKRYEKKIVCHILIKQCLFCRLKKVQASCNNTFQRSRGILSCAKFSILYGDFTLLSRPFVCRKWLFARASMRQGVHIVNAQ